MIEMLVGMNITNDEDYSKYREGITPILTNMGGGFGYDLKVSEVLKTESKDKINRVFTIFFPDEEKMDSFFSDEQYLSIKEEFFLDSVEATTIMAMYHRHGDDEEEEVSEEDFDEEVETEEEEVMADHLDS